MPWELTAAVGLLFFSSILPMKYAVAADALALLAYGFMARLAIIRSTTVRSALTTIVPVAGVLLLLFGSVQIPAFSAHGELVENFIVTVVVLYALFFLIAFRKQDMIFPAAIEDHAGEKSAPAIALAVFTILVIHNLIISVNDRQFPFVPDFAGIKQRIFIHQAPPSTAALMKWARTSTPQTSLFAICPDEWDDFGGFRLVAERGLYITIVEVNQLSLDAAVYNQGHQRVLALGTRFPRRREYDTRGYYDLSLLDLKSLVETEHIDFMVFRRSSLHGFLNTVRTAYSDEHYIVVDLHSLTLPSSG
jgi:uncharacterized membrane protein